MALQLSVVLMGIEALLKLRHAFWRLIWEQSPDGANDLQWFHTLVHQWFAGRFLYTQDEGATYPPATYAILWPLLGWGGFTPARWLWAATAVVALAWLAYLLVRESGAKTPLERLFIALMILSIKATSVTIGNGQLIIHLLPALLAGLVLIHRGRGTWGRDLVSAALILASLVKPSVSVPFFWMVLFVPRRPRPALLICLGYTALTMFSASFQDAGLPILIRGWLARSSEPAVVAGNANLHLWLGVLGLKQWIFPVSLVALGALGLWSYVHRDRDFWLLLGVTALVARLWTYHQFYDDLLVLLPIVALFRLAKGHPRGDGGDITAGLLLAITYAGLLAPGRPVLFGRVWHFLFGATQAAIWIVVLIFFLTLASREKTYKSAV